MSWELHRTCLRTFAHDAEYVTDGVALFLSWLSDGEDATEPQSAA